MTVIRNKQLSWTLMIKVWRNIRNLGAAVISFEFHFYLKNDFIEIWINHVAISINVWLSKLIHWPEYIKSKSKLFQIQIPKYLNREKFTGFYKNNECMHLLKQRKYIMQFTANFFFEPEIENRNGKLQGLFWSSYQICSIKRRCS